MLTTSKKTKLLNTFSKLYPEPKSELSFQSPYQLVVSVMLSAQCTDKKVNETTPSLFSKYPNFKALSSASLKEIEKIIRPINYYKTKSKHLIEMSKLVVKDFGGRLPRTQAELVTLPGVGQKTANVILSEQGDVPAFPVDTHVFRVSKRLGLAKGTNPKVVEEELKAAFEPERWHSLHHWLIFHGRRVCKAQNPKCAECALSSFCPSRQVP